MTGILRLLWEALSTGVLVAFVALGYSLVYGVLRFVNFAHGEIVAVSAYSAHFFCLWLGINSIWGACILGGVTGAAVAIALERIVYRPLRGSGGLTLLLASFGASLTIQATLGIAFGTRSRVLALDDSTMMVASMALNQHSILLVVSATIAAASLEYGLHRSIWGLVVRGYSKNPLQVAVLGAPIDRSICLTFAVGGFLAGIVGVCLGIQSGVNPQMGQHVSLWAFAATVVGGLGSVRGTLLGGISFGVILALATRFLSVLHTDGIAFLAMAVVLLVRPKGIFVFADRAV